MAPRTTWRAFLPKPTARSSVTTVFLNCSSLTTSFAHATLLSALAWRHLEDAIAVGRELQSNRRFRFYAALYFWCFRSSAHNSCIRSLVLHIVLHKCGVNTASSCSSRTYSFTVPVVVGCVGLHTLVPRRKTDPFLTRFRFCYLDYTNLIFAFWRFLRPGHNFFGDPFA